MPSRKEDFDTLLEILRYQDYKHIDRLNQCSSTMDISIQNYIAIVAFIGNITCRKYCDGLPFPPVYLQSKLNISKDDQARCCELIPALAEKLVPTFKLRKLDIISSCSPRYFAKRADFLRILCEYFHEQIVTPPSSPPGNDSNDSGISCLN